MIRPLVVSFFIAMTSAFACAAHADFGIIRLYNTTRGMGWINPSDGSTPVFFTAARIADPDVVLGSGDCVSYTPIIAEADAFSPGQYKSAADIRRIECP
jgi:cold shock CspA family protein